MPASPHRNTTAARLRSFLRQVGLRLGLVDDRPMAKPGWSGNNLVATMNDTGFMFEVRDRMAEEFIRHAGECGGPVLEIGCAYGVSTIPALAAGGTVTACDMEPQHLEILHGKVPPEHLPRLTLVTGKLPEVDFPENHYAAILCSRVLHFLEGDDVDASVRKMARWLVPGGRLYLLTDTPYGVWRKSVARFEAAKSHGERWPGLIRGLHQWLATPPRKPIEKPAFLNLMDPDILTRSCREAGLEVMEAAFIARPDFGEKGRMDGRENAVVLAVRPGG